MQRRSSRRLAMILILTLFLCTSCQLMPVEEALPAAPVIRSYKGEEYKETTVMQGDLSLVKAVHCTCMMVRKESCLLYTSPSPRDS